MTTPHVDDPATWIVCLAAGCTERVPPTEHSFRCAAHRDLATRRRLTVATPSEAFDALDALEQIDRAAAWRVLVLLANRHPTSVCEAVGMVADRIEAERIAAAAP